MFTIWILLLISTVSSQYTETTVAPNITTLYPVNRIISKSEIQIEPKDTENKSSDTETERNCTGTGFNEIETTSNDKTKSYKTDIRPNETESKSKPYHQSWKIESGFAESNFTERENDTDSKVEKEKNELLKDFKPSQHLGSFFNEESAEVIKKPSFGLNLKGKKPASGFFSSPKDEYFNNIPKEIYQTHKEFPYKFEETIYTRTKEGWQEPMDSKPTVEVPVKVPAGGFYKSPDAFKQKPNNDEDFALTYYEDEGGREHAVKKRANPWQSLLRLVTAFIPVGLIISALTPSVITIHDVDDGQPTLPYRRSDAGADRPALAPISEQCRRRLLCELHSERNYTPPSSVPRRKLKHCYKIPCEDTEALWRMLRWLLTYTLGADGHGERYLT